MKVLLALFLLVFSLFTPAGLTMPSSRQQTNSGSALQPKGASSDPVAPQQVESAPHVVQTNNYNFRISTHEIVTSSAYIYVTPAGNYSFSQAQPFEMSYTSLWGNTTQFSGYGVNESGSVLSPGTTVISVAQTSFSFNTTQLSGPSIHGHLLCSYDFSRTPEKTSCKYQEAKGIATNFNIVMLTTGTFLSEDGSQALNASAPTGLVVLGNSSSVLIGATPDPTAWRTLLRVDWSDFGLATLLYGEFMFAGVSYHGAVVQFPQDVSSVDPTIVQDQDGYTQSNVCWFSTNVIAGDLLIVNVNAAHGTADTVSSDSQSLTWSSTFVEYNTVDQYSLTMLYAIAASSASESVTLTFTAGTTWSVDCYEISGVENVVDTSSTGGARSYNGGPFSPTVSSYSPSSGDFVFATTAEVTATSCTNPAYSAGSGYTIALSNCNLQSPPGVYFPQGEEYVASWGSGSTTSPFTPSFGEPPGWASWGEVSVAFKVPVTQPISATLNSVYGGSTQSITVSGCSPSPSTFSGDGGTHNIVMSNNCTYSLALPSGYQWTTSSSSTACSSGTCSAFSATYERSPVTLPVKATRIGTAGSNQLIDLTGCSTNHLNFYGDGSVVDLTVSPSCTVTATLPVGYMWNTTNTVTKAFGSCSSGDCPTEELGYMDAPESTLNVEPNGLEPLTSFVNLTGSQSKVVVTLYDGGATTLYGGSHNNLNGGSCAKAPCTPPSGNWSFQFNIVFPKFLVDNATTGYNGTDAYVTSCPSQLGRHEACGPFTVQATVEAYQNGTCKAEPQGAPSAPPAPDVSPQDSFGCGAFTSPGDNFAWVVDTSGGTNANLTDVKFQINGVTNDTWDPFTPAEGMFVMPNNPGYVTMKDVYAQSSFTGGIGGGAYGNFYSGGGFLSYTGAENLFDNKHCSNCVWYYTSEYSNTEYTSIPSTGTSFNQTFDAGVFANVYEGSSGSVSNASDSIGPPSGEYARLQALTSGSSACLEDAFVTGGPVMNGTIAIYGYSESGNTSSVQVAVSTSSSSSCSSGTGWTTVYTKNWTGSSAANWIPLNSTSQVEYVKITASYSGGAADIYVGSISMFMGSYGESQTDGTNGTSSSVTNPGYALGVNDTKYAVLQASSSGSAWIQVGFGTEYSGDLQLRGYLSNAGVAVTVEYSSTGAAGSWTTDTDCTGSGTSLTWIDCGGISQALYVLITVSYGTQAGDLYLDAVSIA